MFKIELKRAAVINLYAAMNAYIAKVGKNADKLAWMCNSIITHDGNEDIIEKQNKGFEKLKKEFERSCKKLANNYAKTYEEGDKKGTFILDEKKEFVFSPSSQNKLNDAIDELADKYELDVSELQKEKVEIYIEKVSVIPDALPIEFKNALELLIQQPE